VATDQGSRHQDRDRRVRALASQGVPWAKIAKDVGLSTGRVRSLCADLQAHRGGQDRGLRGTWQDPGDTAPGGDVGGQRGPELAPGRRAPPPGDIVHPLAVPEGGCIDRSETTSPSPSDRCTRTS
jgi:hypothetical protein